MTEPLLAVAVAEALPTTVTTLVPGGVTDVALAKDPQPTPPPIVRARSNRNSRLRRRAESILRRHASKPPSARPGKTKMLASTGVKPIRFMLMAAMPLLGPIVVTVKVEVCAVFEPFAVRLAGWKLHDEPAGSPVQAKVAVPVNPPTGVKVNVACPVWPDARVSVAGFTLSA